ncbi:MAG: phosphatidate cytidylyltransferase [Alphaproteobacteria bacterium]|nr:phosphatidate cytidylyltransferase [Alphaproteobacteria bacterium]MBN9557514.1 phosphatidate cytidylyltransferase [Alphaproteobacteria bacterium]MBN9569262.1 phosphatidate cytidylyltransferase [Alphaproteobacteria bacterium]MBN9570293.1 phosphatidate cytidylyltransferase [Alphaproteobacteria bacterium]MBN9579795.1 phosphatidate cytidylyltransferase [Alphaproteobacteria bacterium]
MIDTPDTAPLGQAFSAGREGGRRLRFSLGWITRPVFGLALAVIAASALWMGSFVLAAFVALTIVLAAREWHRMVSGQLLTGEFFVTAIAVAAAVFSFAAWPGSVAPWLFVLAGAAVSLVLAVRHRRSPLWEAGGVLYLGVPALALVALRAMSVHGFLIVLAMFVAIWATDTGALVVGKLVGGPKLWPALSPNKTWAGAIGGMVFAIFAGGVVFSFLALNVVHGALFAAFVGAIAQVGDLFESWAKRRFRIKDSGGLIPGHGGVLDRIDSTLLVAPVLAVVVLVVQFDPLGALI